MPYLPKGVREEAELAKILDALRFPPEVVRWRYEFKDDMSGDPAVYFYFVLSDEVGERSKFHEAAERVKSIIDQLDVFRQWGLFPYPSFRTESEQAELKDKQFA